MKRVEKCGGGGRGGEGGGEGKTKRGGEGDGDTTVFLSGRQESPLLVVPLGFDQEVFKEKY